MSSSKSDPVQEREGLGWFWIFFYFLILIGQTGQARPDRPNGPVPTQHSTNTHRVMSGPRPRSMSRSGITQIVHGPERIVPSQIRTVPGRTVQCLGKS